MHFKSVFQSLSITLLFIFISPLCLLANCLFSLRHVDQFNISDFSTRESQLGLCQQQLGAIKPICENLCSDPALIYQIILYHNFRKMTPGKMTFIDTFRIYIVLN